METEEKLTDLLKQVAEIVPMIFFIGTTAVAALMEKRHFIGFETNKEYFDMACKRIKDEQAQLTLF